MLSPPYLHIAFTALIFESFVLRHLVITASATPRNYQNTYKYSYPVSLKYIVTISHVDLSICFFFSFLSTQFFDTKLISIYNVGLRTRLEYLAKSWQRHFSVSIVITFPIFSVHLFFTENFTWTWEIRLHNVSFNCLK